MVFDEGTPGYKPAFLLMLVGVLVTVAAWYYFFVVRSYPYAARPESMVNLGFENALICAQPWQYLDCKEMMLRLTTMTSKRLHELLGYSYLPALLGLVPIGYAYWADTMDKGRRRTVSGYPVVPASAAAKKLRAERKTLGEGLRWLPELDLSIQREKLGILVTGAPGMGKTLVFWPLVLAAQARGDRVVIIDTKGDFTAGCAPDIVDGKDVDPIILAPHDKRSAVWMIAEDVLLPEDAIELATLLIPDVQGQNQYFPQAARAILVVSILRLIALRPGKWSWAELVELARRPTPEMLKDAEVLYPEAKPFLNGEGSDVTAGTTGTVSTAMQNLRILASVWTDDAMADPAVEKFSLKRFLSEPQNYAGRTVILQRSGRFSNLTDRWMTAFLTMAGTLVGTPEMQENDKSPVWFFVDEFGELPKVDKFQKLVNQGRSKGVRVMVAAQDVAQIKDVYGGNLLETYQTMFATRVIGQMNPGEPATKLATDLGDVVQRWQVKVPNGSSGHRWEDKESRLPAVSPGDLSYEIGIDGKRRCCWMFLVGVSKGPTKIAVPFMEKRELREPVIPAAWTEKPFELHGAELAWLMDSDKRTEETAVEKDSAGGRTTDEEVAPVEQPKPEVSLGGMKPVSRPRGYEIAADDAAADAEGTIQSAGGTSPSAAEETEESEQRPGADSLSLDPADAVSDGHEPNDPPDEEIKVQKIAFGPKMVG